MYLFERARTFLDIKVKKEKAKVKHPQNTCLGIYKHKTLNVLEISTIPKLNGEKTTQVLF